MISDAQFERTRQLALALAGVELVQRHRPLLISRAQRCGLCDASRYDEMLRFAEQGDPHAIRQATSLITTRFTRFFRNPEQIAAAIRHIRSSGESAGQARIWSAGAATGQEAWSIAIAAVEAFDPDEPPIRILATDVEETALSAAAEGRYMGQMCAGLSDTRRERFFPGGRTAASIRNLVEFRADNLVGDAEVETDTFDVISCRNVLMYLAPRARLAALRRMVHGLKPNGLLILDPLEYLGDGREWFAAAGGGLYTRRKRIASGHAVKAPVAHGKVWAGR
jgi:chemotaxis protein methyltransferase CheR